MVMTNPRQSYKCILIILASLFFIVFPVSAFIYTGSLLNGPSFDIVESGGYLYVAQGSEVRIYDVSSSARMSALDWKDSIASIPVGSAVYALELQSGYLYIGSATKFVIADVKNPKAPVIAGTLKNPYPDTEIRDVVLNGDLAYLNVVNAGVLVVDISNKNTPRQSALVELKGSNQPWRATLSGSYLYVGSAYDNQLTILDLRNPQKPVIAGNYSAGSEESDSVSGVAVRGNYAYITEYHNGVRVIDVSNPAAPVEVSNLMDINANDIKILGNYAYVSVRYQGFDIIDISNPKSIEIIGQATDVPCYEEGIFPTESYTYISLESVGFGIYDTSTKSSPVTLAQVHTVGGADSVAARGNYLYIGAHNDDVWVVDISDPSRPKEIAAITNNGRNSNVQLQGNYLYVAGEWSGVYLADVSSPSSPRWVVEHFDSGIHTVLPDGNYVYTEKGIVDFSIISSPAYEAESPYFYGEAAKYGDRYLLVAISDGVNDGVHVIDVINKANPINISIFDPGVPYTDVVVSGTTGVAVSGNSVVAIDLSNPAMPKETDRAEYPGVWAGEKLASDGSTVYAAGTGLRAFDVSDKNNIKLVDTFQPEESINSVVFSDGHLFLGKKMGVTILSPGNPQLDPEPTGMTGIMDTPSEEEEYGTVNIRETFGMVDTSGAGGGSGTWWDALLNFLRSLLPR
ncbi:MAG TPA: hypothetical protein PKZ65_00460 [Methanoregulaceae archaeon]|nr:hypothetical protein [Methanoregulaceae archaeon]